MKKSTMHLFLLVTFTILSISLFSQVKSFNPEEKVPFDSKVTYGKLDNGLTYYILEVDVRLIAASNQDLRRLVASGQFREDLFHRLDLFRLRLPPLRERVADIVPLAETLLARIIRRQRLAPRPITPEGRRRLEQWPWPGNVRELAHEIERALVFEDGPLAFEHLERVPPGSEAQTTSPVETWFNPSYRFPPTGFSLERAVDRLVQQALAQSEGNASAAARLLGVSRDVVRYRIAGKGAKADED